MFAKLDDAQRKVVVNSERNHQVAFAVPGAGKTTMLLETARRIPKGQKMLILAYNRALKDSMTDRIHRDSDPTLKERVFVFTFHGLATHLAEESTTVINNDIELEGFIANFDTDFNADWQHSNFTVLAIDESQDTRPIFFKLIKLLVTRVCNDVEALRLIVTGDVNQLLYDFYSSGNADSRFLLMAPILLQNVNNRQWDQTVMNISYRMTPRVANFVNNVHMMNFAADPDYKYHEIIAGNASSSNKPVVLRICNVYEDVVGDLAGRLSEYDCGEVLLISSSTNKRSPLVKVVNGLLSKPLMKDGKPFKPFVVESGSSRSSSVAGSSVNVEKDKVRVKTFHASKGLEAKLCVVINTRNLFHDLENSSFVANTRGIEKLVIYQNSKYVTQGDLEAFARLFGTDPDGVQITVTDHMAKSRKKKTGRVMSRLTSDSLFSFVECNAIDKMMDDTVIDHESPPFTSTEEEEEEEADEDEMAKELEKMLNDYNKKLTITTAGGDHVSISHCVSAGIKMGTMYAVSGKIPSQVTKTLMANASTSSSSMSPQQQNMIDTCINVGVTNIVNVRKSGISMDMVVKRSIGDFVNITTAIDSSTGYCDMLQCFEGINIGGKVTIPAVFKRIDRVLYNAQLAIEGDIEAEEELKNGEMEEEVEESPPLVFSRSQSSKYRYNGNIVTISSTADILASDRFIVHFTSMPQISNNVILKSVVDCDIFAVKYCYIINILDGCMIKVHESGDFGTFMQLALNAKFATELKMSDREFTAKHSMTSEELKSGEEAKAKRNPEMAAEYEAFEDLINEQEDEGEGGDLELDMFDEFEDDTEDEAEEESEHVVANTAVAMEM